MNDIIKAFIFSVLLILVWHACEVGTFYTVKQIAESEAEHLEEFHMDWGDDD